MPTTQKPVPENDPLVDQLLGDLYKIHRMGWEKLLAKLGLPANIGIVNTMTLGQAKEYAAGHGGSKSSEGAQSYGTVPTQHDSVVDAPGTFVDRLVVSAPSHFNSDQNVTPHPRNALLYYAAVTQRKILEKQATLGSQGNRAEVAVLCDPEGHEIPARVVNGKSRAIWEYLDCSLPPVRGSKFPSTSSRPIPYRPHDRGELESRGLQERLIEKPAKVLLLQGGNGPWWLHLEFVVDDEACWGRRGT